MNEYIERKITIEVPTASVKIGQKLRKIGVIGPITKKNYIYLSWYIFHHIFFFTALGN